MAQKLNLAKPHRQIHVGVILMNSETELQDVAPVDLLHGLSSHWLNSLPDDLGPPGFKAGALDMAFHWVTEGGPGAPGALTSGLGIVVTDSFESCPPLDIVLIGAAQFGYQANEAELAFVRKCYEECTAFLTVCGGVEIPRAAGILDGKSATGPRAMIPFYQSTGTTTWLEKRWVHDGKVWTSGALFNGCDMVHAFIKHTWAGTPTAVAAGFLATMGSWPDRDVDYKDGP
ncbi:class I glutamine amidotransferase-like protein [Xylaria telfairii]|nr:class I glutamine amidotransferase-like protein [Xylaria telfairii]